MGKDFREGQLFEDAALLSFIEGKKQISIEEVVDYIKRRIIEITKKIYEEAP